MEINDYFDNVFEYEIDDSWRSSQTEQYQEYRRQWGEAEQSSYNGDFPLSIEIEASYHCNLECPFCPRAVNIGERSIDHIGEDLWKMILTECRDHRLPSMLMAHEGESLMNPRFLSMVKEARDAGIFDVWVHTNANMLNPKRSVDLINAGLTKINFSIDATSPETYDVLRPGGNYDRVIDNVKNFLRLKLEHGAHYLRTRVSFVEQEANQHERMAFFDYWKDIPGLNLITYQVCIDFAPYEHLDDEMMLTENQLHDKYHNEDPFHCSEPWKMPVVDIEGNVIPCGQPVRSHNSDFILGNLFQGDTIESCWNGTKMRDLRDLHKRGDWYQNPMCRVCVNTSRASRKHAEERGGAEYMGETSVEIT